jgi:hypothetical protein
VYEFKFSVPVNLSDGMDSSEATLVASRLFEYNMKHKNYEVKETQANGDGTWTVYLLWGSVSASGQVENHSHYYNVHVNVTDRTVEYDRCY